MKYFLCVLGMVMIIEGLPYFAFPEKIKQYMMKIQEISAQALRIMGLTAMIIGLLCVYFGRT